MSGNFGLRSVATVREYCRQLEGLQQMHRQVNASRHEECLPSWISAGARWRCFLARAAAAQLDAAGPLSRKWRENQWLINPLPVSSMVPGSPAK